MAQANVAVQAFENASELSLCAWAQALAEAVLGTDGADSDEDFTDALLDAEEGEATSLDFDVLMEMELG